MDFLCFFGNVFDPRQMHTSVQGSGVYINRVQGYSIDPIYIDDLFFPQIMLGEIAFGFISVLSLLKKMETGLYWCWSWFIYIYTVKDVREIAAHCTVSSYEMMFHLEKCLYGWIVSKCVWF